jgi:chromosome segregation ATPase
MREHFRTFDSKITFFAFADIITAVSGMLVFITLLLATDLGRPVTGLAKTATTETEQQLQQTLDQQTEVDAQINRLQELLAAVETAPNAGQLQSDIASLRVQLADEKKKAAVLDARMAGSQTAIAARDKVLGLTDLKATVDATFKEAQAIAAREADERTRANDLESQITHANSELASLREREG